MSTINYGINIHTDSKELLVGDDDLLTQVVYTRYLPKDESASIVLNVLQGRKSFQYGIGAGGNDYLGGGHKITRESGNKIKWEAASIPAWKENLYLLVFVYT